MLQPFKEVIGVEDARTRDELLVADLCAVTTDKIFALPPEQLTPQLAWLGAITRAGRQPNSSASSRKAVPS